MARTQIDCGLGRLTVHEAFVEMMYNRCPMGRIAIFDDADSA